MQKLSKPKITYTSIRMLIEIPFEQWEKYGVTANEHEESEHAYLGDDFFLVVNTSLHQIPAEIKKFNTLHGTNFDASDFIFNEERALSFKKGAKSQRINYVKIYRDQIVAGILISTLIATLATFAVLVFQSFNK